MTVRFLGVCGVLVALGGIWSLRALDPARRPEQTGAMLRKQDTSNSRAQAVVAFDQAVRSDSANAYRWADLAESLAAADRVEEGRRAMQRATDLAPGVPQIWFHDAIFHFQVGENAQGLRATAKILDETSEYDAVFFDYFDRLKLNSNDVLAVIEHDRRAARSYTEHLIRVNNSEGAQSAWHVLSVRGFADDRLTSSYISYLLRNHQYEAARQDWAASRGPSDYPARNLVFNGEFERDISGCPLDWTIQDSPDFETIRDNSVAHEGRWSLRVNFRGNGNVSYANLMQTIPVVPGRYEFRAWMRTEGITTDEGVRIQIFDPESASRFNTITSSFTGTHDWTPIEISFTVPKVSTLIAVQVVRSPSLRFDNAIAGTAWLDSVSLRRAQ